MTIRRLRASLRRFDRQMVAVACLTALPMLLGCSKTTFGRMVRPMKCMVAEHYADGGERQLARGNHAAAIESFTKAVEIDPTSADAHAKLGTLLEAAGHYEEAIAHHREAVRHDPANQSYALGLARALRSSADASMSRERDLLAAVRAYKHACWLSPDSFDAAFELGLCYRELGRYDEAIQVLRTAGTLNRASAAVHDQIGEMYVDRGLEGAALQEFRAALTLAPNDAIAHRGIGRVYLHRHRRGEGDSLCLSRAAAHLRKSLSLMPDQPSIEETLAGLQAESPRSFIAIDEDADTTP